MVRGLIFVAITLLLAACDGGFLVRGNAVASTSTAELGNCKLAIIDPKDALHCCDSTVNPNNIDTLFTVNPNRETYTVSLECEGYMPYVTKVRYGRDVSPSKPLDLGTVVLVPK
jgi:hypothetical protein